MTYLRLLSFLIKNNYVLCVWYKTWLIKICKNTERETLSASSKELRVLETIMLRNNV